MFLNDEHKNMAMAKIWQWENVWKLRIVLAIFAKMAENVCEMAEYDVYGTEDYVSVNKHRSAVL